VQTGESGAARGVYRKPIGPVLRRAYFLEPPGREVRGTPLPRTPMNKGKGPYRCASVRPWIELWGVDPS
jgi:hypothetical protein